MRLPTTVLIKPLFAVALLAVSSIASGQTLYRYVDQNGKVHYSERPPIEATGRATDKLGPSGTIKSRTSAAPTAEERAAAESERKRKEQEEVEARVENRRTQAILNAYASENDLEKARAESLRPVREIIAETEAKIARLDARWNELDAEAKSAQGKPIPPKLRMDLRQVETDRKALQQLLEAKQKEERAITTRFDEDKRRYVEGRRARASNAKQASGAQ